MSFPVVHHLNDVFWFCKLWMKRRVHCWDENVIGIPNQLFASVVRKMADFWMRYNFVIKRLGKSLQAFKFSGALSYKSIFNGFFHKLIGQRHLYAIRQHRLQPVRLRQQ